MHFVYRHLMKCFIYIFAVVDAVVVVEISLFRDKINYTK